jgi:sugar phosphate isomerase/epimerase
MSLSHLPLSYCTNVHPGRSVAEVEAGLDRYTVSIARAYGQPLAAGLWLANPVVNELLAAPDAVKRFADSLTRRGLTCHTLNAFPYGDFHGPRVKDQVYLPDWTQPQRLAYTERCAAILAALLPSAVSEGSISTLPLGFKEFDHPPDFLDTAADALIECARRLDRLRQRTGKLIRLAIEPEPLCALETTPEAIAFFQRLHRRAKGSDEALVREHLGLCYDVCHQAVEFEDIPVSIRALDAAGVRINKVHLSCAIELTNPAGNPEGRAALRRYVEGRYLHQTTASLSDGTIARVRDITEEFVDRPPPPFLAAPAWRVHFHVPVDAEHLGLLATTRSALKQALAGVARLSYAPHLEVETYTWEVLPDAPCGPNLVEGLMRELQATRREIIELAGADMG